MLYISFYIVLSSGVEINLERNLLNIPRLGVESNACAPVTRLASTQSIITFHCDSVRMVRFMVVGVGGIRDQ